MSTHDAHLERQAESLLFTTAVAFHREGYDPDEDEVLWRTLAAVAAAHHKLVATAAAAARAARVPCTPPGAGGAGDPSPTEEPAAGAPQG